LLIITPNFEIEKKQNYKKVTFFGREIDYYLLNTIAILKKYEIARIYRYEKV